MTGFKLNLSYKNSSFITLLLSTPKLFFIPKSLDIGPPPFSLFALFGVTHFENKQSIINENGRQFLPINLLPRSLSQ